MRSRLRPSVAGLSASLIAGVSIIGLFVVMTLTTRRQGIPAFDPPDIAFPDAKLPEQSSVTPSIAPPTQPPTTNNPALSAFFNVVAILLLIAVVALVVFFIARAARALWQDRRLRLRRGSAVAAEVVAKSTAEPAIDAPIMRRGISTALAAIDETAEPGDAIIAAWLGLEETASNAGITRALTETPAEFVVRLIVRTQEIREPADLLLNVYEQVRFGGKVATEHERAIARGALQRIEAGWK